MSSFAAEPARPRWTHRLNPARFALLVWAVVSLLFLIGKSAAIAGLDTIDPDDALRLVQVRDLLGGQAWWDVSQHRINPLNGGGLMHWSRLVDAPIAAGIWALTPLLGRTMAEQVVAALWPLLLACPVFVVLAKACRRMGDWRISYIAPLLLATNIVILFQLSPLRVDHHGFQIMLSLVALALLARPPAAANGVGAAMACAALIAISLEGLPTVALLAAIIALEWAWTGLPSALVRLRAFLGTLALGAFALQWMTRGPVGLSADWCDSLSRPYLAALAVAAIGVIVGSVGARRWLANPVARVALLGVCAALAGAALLWVAPSCSRGPFAMLDPVVNDYWYANVREGRPMWVRFDEFTVAAIMPTLIGLIGSVLVLRRAGQADERRVWLIWLAALSGTAILSMLVIRTASLAQLFAMPGCAVVGLSLWRWARSLISAPARIFATLLCAVAIPPIAGMAVAMPLQELVPGFNKVGSHPSTNASSRPCINPAAVAVLNRMPPTLLFAPLDIGPHILQRTPHSVLATGHHRNNAIMAQVISGFLAPSDKAEGIVRATRAPYLVACPQSLEFDNFAKAPGPSLAKDLRAGKAPTWLEPVPTTADTDLKIYRVR